MQISFLASGSAGNAVWVQAGATSVLVDAGLSLRELGKRLRALPGALHAPDAVLVTHEHGDHGKHAAAYAEAGWPVHATAGTALALDLSATIVRADEPLTIGALRVTPVALPHDAADPVGYILDDGTARFGLIHDCGWDDPDVATRYAGVDALAIEFNHDTMFLQAGPYPAPLKRRIASNVGHLSNQQAASLLKKIVAAGGKPQLVVLCHLSKVNNRPRIARDAARAALGPRVEIVIAEQESPTAWIEVGARCASTRPVRSQLAFEFAVAAPRILRLK